MRLESGAAEIDAVAFHRHALLLEQSALASALRRAAIGANDARPRQDSVDRRQDEADKARRAWIDVSVGADKPGWNGADAANDARSPFIVLGHGQKDEPGRDFRAGLSDGA